MDLHSSIYCKVGMIMIELSIQNIKKRFGKKQVLQGLDITLTPGVYALVGKNGAGKSTLMQILTGILSVDEGEILLNGVKIHPQDSKFSKMIGYLPQDTPIYKNFSSEKFLCYLATVKGVEKKKRLEKVKQSLEMVNLEKSSHTLLKNFSGGMKRRIGIAHLLLDDSAIIIVDEPTVGLDPKERIRFYNILSTISKEKIVILSTHIMSDISFISKEILLMRDGKIIKQGSPQHLLSELEKFVWSVDVTLEELPEIQAHFQTGAVKKVDHYVHNIRILSKIKPHEKAKLEIPELEDLYLYYLDGEC